MNSYTYYELIVTSTTIMGLIIGFCIGYLYTFLRDQYINDDQVYINKDNIKYICAAIGIFIGYISGIIFFLMDRFN
ncbi:putative ORfan [Saudi moumouvirus]|nr:putative ORfan [Saudi moumouvirus]